MKRPSLTKLTLLAFTIAVLSLFLINTDWEVEHRITINADTATIWAVLSDLERYPEWNRYSPRVEGELRVGEVVWVEAHLDSEIQRVQNYVLSIVPEQELCWQSAGWYGFLARGTRCRWLVSTGEATTELVHHEIMQGPLAWLMEMQYRERIEKGLKMLDESLAERAEFLFANKLSPTPSSIQ